MAFAEEKKKTDSRHLIKKPKPDRKAGTAKTNKLEFPRAKR